mgnify:CR=1 FL=1
MILSQLFNKVELTAETDEEGRELLRLLGMPFRRVDPQPVQQQKPTAA